MSNPKIDELLAVWEGNIRIHKAELTKLGSSDTLDLTQERTAKAHRELWRQAEQVVDLLKKANEISDEYYKARHDLLPPPLSPAT